MTQEEREAKLKEMMSDAKTHEDQSFERALASRRRDEKESDEMAARATKDSEADKASFIKDMNKNLYASGKESLEERIGKLKHQRQKGSTEMHSFLKR